MCIVEGAYELNHLYKLLVPLVHLYDRVKSVLEMACRQRVKDSYLGATEAFCGNGEVRNGGLCLLLLNIGS